MEPSALLISNYLVFLHPSSELFSPVASVLGRTVRSCQNEPVIYRFEHIQTLGIHLKNPHKTDIYPTGL